MNKEKNPYDETKEEIRRDEITRIDSLTSAQKIRQAIMSEIHSILLMGEIEEKEEIMETFTQFANRVALVSLLPENQKNSDFLKLSQELQTMLLLYNFGKEQGAK